MFDRPSCRRCLLLSFLRIPFFITLAYTNFHFCLVATKFQSLSQVSFARTCFVEVGVICSAVRHRQGSSVPTEDYGRVYVVGLFISWRSSGQQRDYVYYWCPTLCCSIDTNLNKFVEDNRQNNSNNGPTLNKSRDNTEDGYFLLRARRLKYGGEGSRRFPR